MTVTAHIDRHQNTIDGVTFKCTHSGQKRAYGDSFYEYDVKSALSYDEVKRVCSEKIYKAMSEEDYKTDYAANRSADNFFRASYRFTNMGNGNYRYVVVFPYTD